MLGVMKVIWRGWKAFAHTLIKGQNWLLMAIAYGVAMGPVALGFRLFSPDPLDRGLGDVEAGTYWLDTTVERQDIRRAQRPW